MINLRDWQKGDSVRNRQHHQQAVDALRELQRRSRLPGKQASYRTMFIGKLMDHGLEDDGSTHIPDYTDARYWIQILAITGADPDAALAFVDDTSRENYDDDDVNISILTATNLFEKFAETHAIPVGGDSEIYVVVTAFYDSSATGNQLHFTFDYPVPLVIPVALEQTGGTDGAAGAGEASWEYTITSAPPGYESLVGTVPVHLIDRPKKKMNPGVYGFLIIEPGTGDLALIWVNETINFDGCLADGTYTLGSGDTITILDGLISAVS